MKPALVADLLIAARDGDAPLDWRDALPTDVDEAYAVQDATVHRLGPVAGWKVGAKSPQTDPQAAPLPAANLLPTKARLMGPAWRLRGIEVELALRVGRDLAPTDLPFVDAFDAVLPVIEVVESRFADWAGAEPLARLADLQSHGALICGVALPLAGKAPDLRTLEARLAFDGIEVARTCGGNPGGDLGRLLRWLIRHAAERGMPLRRGQIVTTGSCTGLLFAPAGARVEAEVMGVGAVQLRF